MTEEFPKYLTVKANSGPGDVGIRLAQVSDTIIGLQLLGENGLPLHPAVFWFGEEAATQIYKFLSPLVPDDEVGI